MGFWTRSKKGKKEGAPPPPRLTQTQELQQWQPESPYHLQPVFQPAGLLPPPAGWTPGPQQHMPPPPPYHQGQPPYAPIVVNQHYYINPVSAPHQEPSPHTASGLASESGHQPVATFPALYIGDVTQLVNQSAALYDQLSSKFNDVMTSIDRENYAGHEKDLFAWPQPESEAALTTPRSAQFGSTDRGVDGKGVKAHKKTARPHQPKGQTAAVATSAISANCFAKVSLYANSRLPMDLPPLRLYIPTYPLLCLAAQFSERAYERPRGAERETYFNADWRNGTKAMVIKSVPMDYMNTIVFAIRGTATFMDWVVNLDMAPASPCGFLDDAGNLCHAGFLAVARKMVRPVAARLRQLLEEDPSRASYSLMITGHSAGGAVASLLYSHMLATSREAESELNLLSGCFRRIHCVTFGTPPVSLLPLAKPDRPELRKSLFLSFVNEGDPVVRVDPAYVRTLLLLYATPPPSVTSSTSVMVLPSREKAGKGHGGGKTPKENTSKDTHPSSHKSGKPADRVRSSKGASVEVTAPSWKVPPCTLSNAGRLVVLRSGDAKARLKGKKTVEERLNEGVVAQTTTDEQLRTVIWGDPVCHLMRLYAGRIETLAVGAVTGKGF